MATLTYLILAVAAAAIVIDGADRALDRHMKARRRDTATALRLVEEFDVRPDPRPRPRGVRRRQPRSQVASRSSEGRSPGSFSALSGSHRSSTS